MCRRSSPFRQRRSWLCHPRGTGEVGRWYTHGYALANSVRLRELSIKVVYAIGAYYPCLSSPKHPLTSIKDESIDFNCNESPSSLTPRWDRPHSSTNSGTARTFTFNIFPAFWISVNKSSRLKDWTEFPSTSKSWSPGNSPVTRSFGRGGPERISFGSAKTIERSSWLIPSGNWALRMWKPKSPKDRKRFSNDHTCNVSLKRNLAYVDLNGC